ncbi:hypothetical protein SLEP1_g22443 [Rubroshorea leprosula]|uniref:Uncharacterized protein n=1 Tax=Rubroshorea leprosula TaxID=152421 RepID=A0AAV5J971_9ROSI|nr:hypothetical protein SLEP1_g22443 [Rubroshorea leprosula]
MGGGSWGELVGCRGSGERKSRARGFIVPPYIEACVSGPNLAPGHAHGNIASGTVMYTLQCQPHTISGVMLCHGMPQLHDVRCDK